MNSGDIVRVWELGSGLGPVERALTALAPCLPGWSREEIASLAIGRRNALLIAARARLFGPLINAFTECPRCRERLEFGLDSNSIASANPERERQSETTLETGEFFMRLRPVNSYDLAAAGACADADAAVKALARGCIVELKQNGIPADFDSLPPDVVTELEAKLSEADPDSSISVELRCPACATAWELPLDIASFFWAELSAEAKRICREVHTLAAAYGWREDYILGMNPKRRQIYLELIAQ
ncbi:MAG TPA: phage baseplate protein [Blastocatellia bacterium]|nr:phage baseplate protein [Blastocatellia bacterium]